MSSRGLYLLNVHDFKIHTWEISDSQCYFGVPFNFGNYDMTLGLLWCQVQVCSTQYAHSDFEKFAYWAEQVCISLTKEEG